MLPTRHARLNNRSWPSGGVFRRNGHMGGQNKVSLQIAWLYNIEHVGTCVFFLHILLQESSENPAYETCLRVNFLATSKC